MGFVVDKQGVLSEKAGMQRTRFESDSVAAEEKTAADHVHGANNHGRTAWVGRPSAVVRHLSAKSADCQRVSFWKLNG